MMSIGIELSRPGRAVSFGILPLLFFFFWVVWAKKNIEGVQLTFCAVDGRAMKAAKTVVHYLPVPKATNNSIKIPSHDDELLSVT